MPLKQFLSLFFEQDEDINVRLLYEKGTGPIITAKTTIQDTVFIDTKTNKEIDINKLNNNGFGVFFVPNSGGFRNKDITHINSYFIDIDFAKVKLGTFKSEVQAKYEIEKQNETGRFQEFIESEAKNRTISVTGILSNRIIDENKEKFLLQHKKDLENATIVETFSGFHIYFPLKEKEKTNDFNVIQKRLTKHFGGDIQVNNPSRLMRLPSFTHQKYKVNPVIKIRKISNYHYTKKEILNTFFKQEKGVISETIVQKDYDYKLHVETKKTFVPTEINWKKPKRPEKRMNLTEFIQYVKTVSFDEFIENFPDVDTGENIHCPFHNDHNPSATMYYSKNGELVFHCFGCEMQTANIITLYKKTHKNVNYLTAVERLAKILGIRLQDSEFVSEQYKKYRLNRDFIYNLIDDPRMIENDEIQAVLKPSRRLLLRTLNDLAETYLQEDLRDDSDDGIFYISIRELTRKHHLLIEKEAQRKVKSSHYTTIYNHLRFLLLLGLVERVPFEKVPKAYQERSLKEKERIKSIIESAAARRREYGEKVVIDDLENEINYYKIPFLEDVFDEAIEIAKQIKEKGIRIKNLNKNDLITAFGEEIAKRVYPDERSAEKHLNLLSKYIKIIDEELQAKGYFIVEEIGKYRITKGKGKYYTKKESVEFLKREIPNLIDKLNVERKMIRSEEKKRKLGFKGKERTINVLFPK